MRVTKNMLVPEYFREIVQPRLPFFLEVSKGRPFLLYLKKKMLQSADELNYGFSQVEHRNFSAVKALPNPWISEFLYKEGGNGMDCSSISELVSSRAIGIRGVNIMYSANRTTSEQFACALADGGSIVNFDDITALDRVPGEFPNFVSFRINPGKRRTGNSIIGNPHDAKYGITYAQIIPAYLKARQLGATRFGIHMMVCSTERPSSYFVETVRAILEVAALLYLRLGIQVEFVNIGGGFGIPYKVGDRKLNLEWIGFKVARLMEEFANRYGFHPKLMTECGRYVTGHHGFLVNPVVSVEQKYRHFIGVESAMSGCPRPAFYEAFHYTEVYSPDGELRTGPNHRSNIAGPKCENWDRLTAVNKPRLLPKSVKVGDIMVTFNCGAHSRAMADNYNGWLRPMEILDQDGTYENVIVIRREESLEDLFRTITPSPNWKLPGQAE